jgi:hypothetical protein
LVLSVECDAHPAEARAKLEALLGPATVIVASGGEWTDPESGEIQDKLHLYWRLATPARTGEEHESLKLARRLAQMIVGADATGVPPVHPLRWPGSWHRKGKPRLARIVGGDPRRETVLSEALMILRDELGDIDETPRRNGELQAPIEIGTAWPSTPPPAAAKKATSCSGAGPPRPTNTVRRSPEIAGSTITDRRPIGSAPARFSMRQRPNGSSRPTMK